MTQRLEDLLSETLQGYAEVSRDVPGMSELVARRGQVVRRRRRAAVAAMSAVVVLGLSATLLPGSGADRAAPPANDGPNSTTASALAPDVTQWIDALRVGPPTDVVHLDADARIIVDNALAFGPPDPPGTWVPYATRTKSGILVVLHASDQQAESRLGLLSPNGRFLERASGRLLRFAVAPDARTVAVVTQPNGEGSASRIEIIDVGPGPRTGAMAALVREATVDPVGWVGERFVWNEEVDQPDEIWSWSPGPQEPTKIDDGYAQAVAEGLLVRKLDDGACFQVVSVYRPRTPFLVQCLSGAPQALSPNGEWAVTDDFELVRVADGRRVVTRIPSEALSSPIGWEDDAVILNVAVNPDEADRRDVLVRCQTDNGRCERVAAPGDLVTTRIAAD